MKADSQVRVLLDQQVDSNRMALNLRDKKRSMNVNTDNKIDAARDVKRD